MLQIEVIGNLGKDAEVKEFSGKKYTCFSVAHTENVRAQNPGEPPVQRTTWLSVYWYGDGGAMLQYLKLGKRVTIADTLPTKRLLLEVLSALREIFSTG